VTAERTDDDTWDLATSVGATATLVAAGRARATRANLINDHFAEPLVRAVGIDFFTRWATGELAAADVDIPSSFWGMQQMTDLLTVRTRYFDNFVVKATSAGIRQVVILASGLDARGYRLAWPADTVVFEIDQPEVLAFKAATLADLKAAPTADLRTVPIDLRLDWPNALREAGFDATRPSAWTAEGLLPFLPGEAQDRLLDNITALSVETSQLASEVALVSNDGEKLFDSLNDVTKRWRDHGFDIELGELGYVGQRNDLADYLDRRGWRSVRKQLQELLIEADLPTIPDVGGGQAFSNNYYCASVKQR
jgi:methyltransferase (TIGR00027 family)